MISCIPEPKKQETDMDTDGVLNLKCSLENGQNKPPADVCVKSGADLSAKNSGKLKNFQNVKPG